MGQICNQKQKKFLILISHKNFCMKKINSQTYKLIVGNGKHKDEDCLASPGKKVSRSVSEENWKMLRNGWEY